MASRLEECMAAMVKAGRITQAEADEAIRATREELAKAEGSISEAVAALRAAESKSAEAKRQKYLTALRINKFHDLMERVEGHEKGYFNGAMATLVRDMTMKDAGQNVYARTGAVEKQAFAMMADFMEKYRSKVFGLQRETEGFTHVVDEMLGESTGDAAAAAMAKGWKDADKFLVDRFNAAGGSIAARPNYVPQWWDPAKMRAAIETGGKAAVADYLKTARANGDLVIRDFLTGEPVSDIRASDMIDKAIENVRTDGLASKSPGAFEGLGMTAQRHQEGRVFEWTNAKAYHDWNDKFGVGTDGLYDAFVNHIHQRSREIAAMEILGPNPDWAVRAMLDIGRRDHEMTNRQAARIEAAWDVANGRASAPENEFVANLGAGVRNWLSAAKLGSSTISRLNDLGFISLTSKFNDLPVTQVMTRYLSDLNALNMRDRMLAARHGIIVQTWLTHANAAMREGLDEQFRGFAGHAADVVMRAAGHQVLADAGRMSIGLEYMAHLADLAGTEFDKLPVKTREQFERYGVDASTWDVARERGVMDDDGMRLLSPVALAKQGGDAMEAGTRLLEMIQTEQDFAIPTPGGAERALSYWAMGRAKPGSLIRELGMSGMQFKTFPLTLMTTHMLRSFEGAAYTVGTRVASLAITTTVLGAFALQLKAIANGKDLRDMTDWRFWTAAFVQGGGAGLLADFIYGATTRQDAVAETLLGPSGGLLSDLINLTLGSAGKELSAQEKNTHFGRELVHFVESNSPGTTLWYARLGIQRLVWDQLQTMIDPDWRTAFARMEEKTRKDTGQQYWWRPGETGPSRAPNLGAALGR